jgi:hypothetical protein
MLITDYFDRIEVVNLPEREDRRKEMTRELETAGMPLKPGKVEIFPAIRPASPEGFPSIGARGCFLSHFTILKRARDEGLANVLVLEDDLAISDRFRAEQEGLVEQLRSTDWGFVYFGHNEEVESASPAVLRPFAEAMMTTHFYGVNRPLFDPLLEFLEALQKRPGGHPDGGPMHLDGAYSTFRLRHPEVVTLIAYPNLGWQRSSRSDVYPSKWFERLPVARQLVDWARACKTWLKKRQGG